MWDSCHTWNFTFCSCNNISDQKKETNFLSILKNYAFSSVCMHSANNSVVDHVFDRVSKSLVNFVELHQNQHKKWW
jgi:hypothetical protein